MTEVPKITREEAAMLGAFLLEKSTYFTVLNRLQDELLVTRGRAMTTALGRAALANFEAEREAEHRQKVLREVADAIFVGYHDDEYGPGMANASRIVAELARKEPSAPLLDAEREREIRDRTLDAIFAGFVETLVDAGIDESKALAEAHSIRARAVEILGSWRKA